MSGMYMLIGTLVALGVLVTIHEFGHFWVERRCGVRVLRFSVGFGKPLFSWRDRHGTEFAVAAIPLGGYVKMLDGRESSLKPEQESEAFNLKPVGQRIAVVAAGPVANFILAFVFFWVLAMLGSVQPKPVIGQVLPNSLAAQAGLQSGLEIVAIDGKSVTNWGDINIRLLQRLGETGQLQLEAQIPGNSIANKYQIALQEWEKGSQELNPIQSLGLEPWRPQARALLTSIQALGPAEMAGLQEQDLILAIDGQPIDEWQQVVDLVQQKPGQLAKFLVERGAASHSFEVMLGSREDNPQLGYLGAGATADAWPEQMLIEVSHGPVAAIGHALSRTWEMSAMTLVSIKKMLFGELSAKNLSGPITIAKVAGASAESGLRSFLGFLAYLSISLGVLNLLPIPVLDGGHLLFYTAEWLRGRPLSEKVQIWGMQIGMALVLCVMFFAVFNDIARL